MNTIKGATSTMGHVVKTPAGTFRANWRDPAGQQKAKTFKTKKEASVFLAEIEGSKNRGTYVSPHAGRIRFQDFVDRWLAGRDVEARTAERTLSMLRSHLLPRWGKWQIAQIDYLSVQEWVVMLGKVLAPTTVAKCHGLMQMIMEAAIKNRMIAANPAVGVKLPRSTEKRPPRAVALTREQFFGQLLPALPIEHRAIVVAAVGAGLRWGECAGLPWAAVDLAQERLTVTQVAVETHASVTLRPYPKSRAGQRTVPMPAFLVAELIRVLGALESEPAPTDLVFATHTGTPPRRSNFRRRVWVPALLRAGLPPALRFHDVRHSYSTWLVSAGVPVNAVQRVMGHAKASTTLNLYTHTPTDYEARVRAALEGVADDPLTIRPTNDDDGEGNSGSGSLVPA